MLTIRMESSSPNDSRVMRSEEHTSELQSPCNLVCRLLLEKKKNDPVSQPYRGYPIRFILVLLTSPLLFDFSAFAQTRLLSLVSPHHTATVQVFRVSHYPCT